MGGGGGSKSQTVGYKYYVGMHMALCHGPIDSLLRIDVDSKEAWRGPIASGRLAIEKPSLFGGDSREGGISGELDFESGGPAQGQNDYLAGVLGGDLLPAFRGVCCAVLRRMYMGMNPYLKKWMFRASRIHAAQDGALQWYDEYQLDINPPLDIEHAGWDYQILPEESDPGNTNLSPPVAGWIPGGQSPFAGGAGTGNTDWPNGTVLWAKTSVTCSPSGIYLLYIYFENGGIVWINGVQTATANVDNSNVISNSWHSVRIPTEITSTGKLDIVIKAFDELGPHGGTIASCYIEPDYEAMQSQWYYGKAAIPRQILDTEHAGWDYQILPEESDPGHTNLSPPVSGWTSGGKSPFAGGAGIGNTDWPNGTVLWAKTSVRCIPGHQYTLFASFENGGIVWINGVQIYSSNIDNDSIIGTYWRPSLIHRDIVDTGKLDIVLKAFDELSTHGGTTAGLCIVPYYDMNPAHIVRECQTNSEWGLGISELEIDETAYTYAADRLFLEQMGISILWDRQKSIDAFISDILRHIDADLAVDNTTGKFRLKLIRDDYNADTLLELNPSNVSQISEFHRLTVAELVNEVTVRYWDSLTGVTKTVTVQNLAMVQIQGGVVSTTIDYPGFTHEGIAARVAARDLRALSYPRVSCTLYTTRIASMLNKGDVFKLSWPDYGVTSMIMRITDIDLGDGLDNRIKIKCTQDTFSLPEMGFTADPEVVWESGKVEPKAVTTQLALELPYLELVQRYGQAFVDDRLAAAPDAGYAGIAAARSAANAINARLYTDAGAGYQEYGSVDFCPVATLLADTGFAGTVWEITAGIDLDLVNVGSWAQIDDELVAIDAVADTQVTVIRGVLDTVPAQHAAGAVIYFCDDYIATDRQEYVDTDEIDQKVVPVTTSGELPLSDATAVTANLSHRAIRPYPPGRVQVNGYFYPDTIAGTDDISVSWAHRDRTLQTVVGSLLGFLDDSIGPESGVTYELDFLDETDTLRKSVTGVSAATYIWDTEDNDCGIPGDGYTLWTIGDMETAFWVDSTYRSTITPDTGVTQWADRSGHNRHATQTTDANQPSQNIGALNGHDVVTFDGSNDSLSISVPQAVPSHVFAVVRTGSLQTGDRVLLDRQVSGAPYPPALYLSNSIANNSPAIFWGTSYLLKSQSAARRDYLVEFRLGPSSVGIRKDGGVEETANHTKTTLSTWTLINNSSVQQSNCSIGALAIVNQSLTAEERQIIEGALMHEFGLEANLPANHPYKDAAPVVGTGAYRLNGKVTMKLRASRDGLQSFQEYEIMTRRSGYGFNYGMYYGGI